MKSAAEHSFYAQSEVPDEVLPTPATAGPWSRSAQHGGPPAGLLTRALEGLLTPDQFLSRISVDLLGPVPVGRHEAPRARVSRPDGGPPCCAERLHGPAVAGVESTSSGAPDWA